MIRVVSVNTVYPGPDTPVSGLFARRRLAALGTRADVRVLHLRPWFPILRPSPAGWSGPVPGETPLATRRRMFYLPGVLKSLDGWWVKRAALPALHRAAAAGRLDAIDAQFGYPAGVGCALAGRALGKPVFITVHGLEPWVLGQGGRRARQLRWALRECAGVVCVSDSLYAAVLAEGVPPDRARVIPNAAGRDVFRPRPREEARRQLGLPATGRLVVSVGRFDREKGQLVLVGAFRRLRERVGDVRLALVGPRDAHEPNYLGEVRALVARSGLAAAVTLPGPQTPEQVSDWLNAADLFALATFHESRSCVILEAMACGVPVVTTPVGDNPMLIDPPHRGLLVPPGDEPALAAALATALGTRWDRDRIAAWGEDHGWAAVGRETERFMAERIAAFAAARARG
jgi:glycosyltransferase involved in cell wall biosynthesis